MTRGVTAGNLASAGLLALVLMATAALATAQTPGSFPHRPVRFLAPVAAGGTGDTIARVIGQRLADDWGQQVVIENRAGAGGVVGMNAARALPPDGYNYVVLTNSSAASEVIYPRLEYDVRRDFVPVVMMGSAPMVIAVNPKLDVADLPTLVARVKQEPGKRVYGSCGVGSAFHLAMELLKHEQGLVMQHVPYKGCAPAVTDALSGEIQIVVGPPPAVMPHVRTGRLRALAVTYERRATSFPDVPTVAQAIPAMTNFSVDNWYALIAPAGTPADLVSRVQQKVTALLDDAGVRKQFAAAGIEVRTGGPAEVLRAYIDDVRQFGIAVKAAGIKPE